MPSSGGPGQFAAQNGRAITAGVANRCRCVSWACWMRAMSPTLRVLHRERRSAMGVTKPPTLGVVKGAAPAVAPTADAAGAPAYRPATWRKVVKVLEDCRQNLERFTRRDD